MESIFYYILLAVSVALIALGLYRIFIYKSSSTWEKVSANILSIQEHCKKVVSEYSLIKYYYPKISYEYTYNKVKYESDTVCNNIENIWVCEVDNYGLEIKPEKRFWGTWKKNSNIEVYVNPSKPEESVVINTLNKYYKSHNLALIASGVLILMVLYAIKQT